MVGRYFHASGGEVICFRRSALCKAAVDPSSGAALPPRRERRGLRAEEIDDETKLADTSSPSSSRREIAGQVGRITGEPLEYFTLKCLWGCSDRRSTTVETRFGAASPDHNKSARLTQQLPMPLSELPVHGQTTWITMATPPIPPAARGRLSARYFTAPKP